MLNLSKMYNSYDATTWLSKPKKALKGRTPADLLKEGEFKQVAGALKGEARYKKISSKTRM
jgi:uncharacterized protein (DUF2384 family)